MEYTLGSLFDGSGGFPLAGTLCGIEPKWAAEVEPYPIAVTRSRFPNMKHLGSVTDIHGGEIEPVDAITFGSPCQDLSVAGKRAGLKHEANGDEETTRSGLFMEAVRIIKEMREATNGQQPRFALWENVPGAFSSNKGEDFRIVLEELIKVAEPQAPALPPPGKDGWPYADVIVGDGWSVAWRTFDAQYWGVPQRRRRIHLVADFAGECAAEVLFEREGVRGHFEPGGAQGQGVAADAQGSVGANGQGRGVFCLPFDTTQVTSPQNGNNPKWGDPCHPLAAQGHPPTVICQRLFQPMSLREENWSESGVRNAIRAGESKSSHVVVQPIAFAQNQREEVRDLNGISVALNAEPGTHQQTYIAYATEPGRRQCLFENHSQDTRYKGPLSVCPMLPAQLGTGGNNTPFVVEESSVRYIVRRLTPTECARLQGFPDMWGHPDAKEDLTEEEYRFWLNVRNTYAVINGKQVKDYTKAQMLKWYNGLHTDSAEYKMWGNGIALPPALYVMQGINEVMLKEELL